MELYCLIANSTSDTSYKTWGKLADFSVPQFPRLLDFEKTTYLIKLVKELNELIYTKCFRQYLVHCKSYSN